MKKLFLAAAAVVVTTAVPAFAHHSFAMFDAEHPTELVGKVTEFKFTSPHTFILLEVKGDDGNTVV